MTSEKTSRRGFLGIAVAAVVAGVVAGVGGYYAGIMGAPPGKVTTSTLTTPGGTTTVTAPGATTTVTAPGGGVTTTTVTAPGTATTSTITAPGTTVTSPPVTTTVTAPLTTTGPKEIVIGCAIPLSRAEGKLGESNQWGYTYATNLINSQGGIYVKELGRALPVRLIIYDDKSDSATSVASYERLATSDKVDFFLGGGGPPVDAHISVSEKYKKLYIGGSLSTDSIWNRGLHYVFGIFIQLKVDMEPLYKWAQTLPADTRPKTIAFWQEDSSEGEEFCGPTSLAATEASQYGFKIVFQEKYTVGTTDFSTLIAKTKAVDPDVVTGIPAPPDFITMLKQMKELDYYPRLIYMHKGWNPISVDESLGKDVAEVTGPAGWLPDLPYGQEMLQAYRNDKHETPFWAAIFNAVDPLVLFEAIRVTGSLDTEKVRNVLLTNTFYTPIGPVKFLQNGRFFPPQYIVQMKYNDTPNELGEHLSMTTVWPDSYAKAKFVYPAPGWK